VHDTGFSGDMRKQKWLLLVGYLYLLLTHLLLLIGWSHYLWALHDSSMFKRFDIYSFCVVRKNFEHKISIWTYWMQAIFHWNIGDALREWMNALYFVMCENLYSWNFLFDHLHQHTAPHNIL
jgi:hypothetical protein